MLPSRIRRRVVFVLVCMLNFLKFTSAQPQNQTSDPEEVAHRLKIPSPWVKKSGGDPGIQTGDWEGGCLTKGLKFPTINLNPSEKNAAVGKSGSSSNMSDIRINKYYGGKRDRFFVKNTGLGTLSIKFELEEMTSEATIRGVGWKDEYILAKADVYWSLDNNHGAQHSVDGQPYALEVQLVHYAKNYGSLEKAVGKDEGVLVISTLFEAVGQDNDIIEPVSRAAFSVGFPNERWRQVHGPLEVKQFIPSNPVYYTYKGRYISEPCGTAKFIVFHQPIPISYKQLDRLRMLRNTDAKLMTGAFIFLPSDYATDDIRRVIRFSSPRVQVTVVGEAVLSKASTLTNSPICCWMAGYFLFHIIA